MSKALSEHCGNPEAHAHQGVIAQRMEHLIFLASMDEALDVDLETIWRKEDLDSGETQDADLCEGVDDRRAQLPAKPSRSAKPSEHGEYYQGMHAYHQDRASHWHDMHSRALNKGKIGKATKYLYRASAHMKRAKTFKGMHDLHAQGMKGQEQAKKAKPMAPDAMPSKSDAKAHAYKLAAMDPEGKLVPKRTAPPEALAAQHRGREKLHQYAADLEKERHDNAHALDPTVKSKATTGKEPTRVTKVTAPAGDATKVGRPAKAPAATPHVHKQPVPAKPSIGTRVSNLVTRMKKLVGK